MRLALTVVDPRAGERRDVVVDADPQVPLADLAPAFGSGGARVFHDGAELAPGTPLGESGLREGAVLSLHDASGCVPAEPAGLVELRVVGGEGAGAVHRLPPGEHVLGPAGAVPLAGPAVVRVGVATTGAVTVTALDGEPRLEGESWEGERLWAAGDVLDLGRVLLGVGVPHAADAVLEPAAATAEDVVGVDYNRPPRLLPPEVTTRFRLPTPPGEPQRRPFPVVAAVLPLLMCVTMVTITGNRLYLAMGLLSPLAVVATTLVDRRNGRTSHRTTLARHRDRVRAVRADAAQALVDERRARRAAAPDPAEVLLTAIGPRARLWERRRRDDDHLLVRVGVADLPSDVVLEDPEQPEHRRAAAETAWRVPVTVSLRTHPVTGIAGAGARATASRLLVQLAVLQSPRDVALHVLTTPDGLAEWDWLRWVPHARAEAGGAASVLVGTSTETWARRVAELLAVLDQRRRLLADAPAGTRLDAPDLVVVLDGARRLRSLPGVVTLLTEGPALGIRLLCCEDDARSLPEECTAVVAEEVSRTRGGEAPVTLRVQRQRHDLVAGVLPDVPAPGWAARTARALAPVRDVSDDDSGAGLPASSRLLDVLGLEPPTPQAVAARWTLAPASTAVVVGESLDGPFSFDLRTDGPHGLVAGTTGSGKSELLQTVVASLAVANTPEAMTFVLVDYKGGAAFKDCVDLPHTVGMVTDLDSHLVSRALTSLGAELHRREHLLAAVGAKDLEDHDDLRAAHPDREVPALPRLLIVIDEFASLARELPGFVTGLVDVAQRGRSLGIHLLLATQRPTGVVSAEIRANTTLRIALRVTDPAESSDVLDAPDAARIPRDAPGRAFVKLGHGSLVPFQAGRVGGRRPGVRAGDDVPPPWSAPLRAQDLGAPAPRRPQRAAAATDASRTDLGVLVAAVREAAADLGLPAPHSPWLPALPELLALDDVADGAPDGAPGPLAAAWGLVDVPARQRRDPLTFDLERDGHLFVVGAPRSGRSQALRTLAAALAGRVGAADLHLYGLDCGGGALLPLAALPHTGAVVSRTDPDRAVRLLGRLREEVLRRQGALGALGLADVGEQRAAAAAGTAGERPWPHLLLLLDRWEGFLGGLADLDGQAPLDLVTTLLREGAGVGVHVVVAGDRQLLTGRTGTLVEEKLLLRLTDPADATMAGLSARDVPEGMAPGRALRSGSGEEVQVALLGDRAAGATGTAQVAALADLAGRTRARDADLPRAARPFRLDALPATVDYERALALTPTGPGRLVALVGVGGDDLAGCGPDLLDGAGTLLVAGPPRSGRSTVLLTAARALLDQGAELVVAAPRPSPLRDLAGHPGVRGVLVGDDVQPQELRPLLDAAPAVPGAPVVLLVDDAELLRSCSADDLLAGLVGRAGRGGAAGESPVAVVVAGSGEVGAGFSNWQVPLRRNRCGVLIAPNDVSAADVVGVRVPRSLLGAGAGAAPGRVHVHLGDGELRAVQVPRTPLP